MPRFANTLKSADALDGLNWITKRPKLAYPEKASRSLKIWPAGFG